MVKRAFQILFLFVAALQAAPQLKNLSSWGSLANGSGWDGESNFRSAAIVCNDGSVYFMAPMRSSETPAGTAGLLQGIYAGNPFSDGSECTLAFSGYDEIFYAITGMVNKTSAMRIAGDGDRRLLVVSGNEVPVFGKRSVFISKLGNTSRKTIGGEDFPPNATLVVCGDGSVVCVGDLVGSFLFRDSALAALTIDLEGDGRAVGFSPDGGRIFFASDSIAADDGATLWICSHETDNGVSEPIVPIEDLRHGKLTNGAEIASASGTEAFAFVTNRSALLDDSGNDYVNNYGSQIVLARKDEGGEWEFLWCDSGRHLYFCSTPAVSADGRYVAFIASPSKNGFSQAYRFDSLTGKVECASIGSSMADADCEAASISPNGRFVGFVTKAANLGQSNPFSNANAWIADFGPVLNAEEDIYVYGNVPSPLTISADATGDAAMMSISWEGELPGRLYRIDGKKETEVASGVAFPAGKGQLYFQRVSDGKANLTVTLTDGEFSITAMCDMTCLTRSFPSVEHASYIWDGHEKVLANAGGYSISGGRFAISGDGKTVAYTTLAKSQSEVYDATALVVRKLRDGTTSIIEDCGVSGAVALTENGGLLFYRTNDGVRRYDVAARTGALHIAGASEFAVSGDGAVCAFVKDGKPFVDDDCLSEETGFTSPQISRDGKVASFLKDGSLYLWKGGEMRLFADGVSRAFMTISGSQILAVKGNTLIWLCGRSGIVELPFKLSSARSLAMSANGRFLAYCRTVGTQQAYRYDLYSGAEESMSVEGDGTFADAPVNPLTAISADGSKLLFATSAGNFVPGKTYSLSNELYVSEVKTDVDTAARSADGTLSCKENDADVVLDLSFEDAEGNDAVVEIVGVPKEISVELLPPDWEHPWYSLKCNPLTEHCCGLFRIRLRYWDGKIWSAAQEVDLDVQNVNDIPFWKEGATTEYSVAEGSDATSVDFAEFADDHDLQNPEPYNDESLSFSLEGAPEWISIDGGVFSMAPGYDIASFGETSSFNFNVVVTDRAGEAAVLPVTVTVSNTNRKPVLAKSEILLNEGEEIGWEAFGASDPDEGDELFLRLGAKGGKWIDKNGVVVGGDVGKERFPLRFSANADSFNECVESFVAVDGGGAVSDNAVANITVNMVRCKASDIWKEIYSGACGGWQLLSVPFAMDATTLSSALGAVPFVWMDSAFKPAEGVLEAGRGFIVFIDAKPADSFVTGDRSLLMQVKKGWNLVGPTLGGGVSHSPSYVLKGASYTKTQNDVAIGAGCWIFVVEP